MFKILKCPNVHYYVKIDKCQEVEEEERNLTIRVRIYKLKVCEYV